MDKDEINRILTRIRKQTKRARRERIGGNMTIEEEIKMKGLIFLRNKNKEIKEEIEKLYNYDFRVLMDLEIEIMKALTNFRVDRNDKEEEK